VQFQGVCLVPLSIITEFCAGGSLFTLLHSKKEIPWKVIVKIIKGCAAGMLHLQREHIIHRDLAARNILLTEVYDPKISGKFLVMLDCLLNIQPDFGMSRVAQLEDGGKTMTAVGPLKWMVSVSWLVVRY
jgi:serine/threonine protein kinase